MSVIFLYFTTYWYNFR